MPSQSTAYEWFLNSIKSHNSDACLRWPYFTDNKGYGRVVYRGRAIPVHRLAFFLANGKWPTPYAIHTCPNADCFNHRHLIEGSHREKYQYFLAALKAHNSDECLLWPFCKGAGYGQVFFEGRMIGTHRLAFYLTNGRWPLPFGCHKCDTPACYNPRHIFEGTQSENLIDARDKARLTPAYGERHSFAKLTEQMVREIRTRYHAGTYGYIRLAKEFGVSPATIKNVVIRKVWKHI